MPRGISVFDREGQLAINQIQKEGREVLDWILYDSMYTTAASTQQDIRFFQNTLGSVGRWRTNMKNAGMLPMPQTFIIEEIYCKFLNDNGKAFTVIADGAGSAVNHPLNQMMVTGYWDFILDPSAEYEGHLSQFFEQVDYMMDAPASKLGTSWARSFTYKLRLQKPIIINPNRSFSLRCNFLTPAAAGGYVVANTLMFWYLKGVLRRNS